MYIIAFIFLLFVFLTDCRKVSPPFFLPPKPTPIVNLCDHDLTDLDIDVMIRKIIINKNWVRSLPECYQKNYQLFLKLVPISNDYFQYADESLRDNEVFIRSLVINYPDILQYISNRLKNDPVFMGNLVNMYHDALIYAGARLLDNRDFMAKMIKKDAKYYKYASERLQEDFDFSLLVVKQNGEAVKYMTPEMQSNKVIAMAAVKSYIPSINMIDPQVARQREVQKLLWSKHYDFLDNFESYLKENYSGPPVGPEGARGYRIINFAKFFSDRIIIDNPYLLKWKIVSDENDDRDHFELSKIKGESLYWKIQLEAYPDLIDKIEKLFKANQVDQDTIDAMHLTSFWKLSDKPRVYFIDLYLIRKVKDFYLQEKVYNVTSLTAIVGKTDEKWHLSVVDINFDASIKMDEAYRNGHKRYFIWDLYKSPSVNPDDDENAYQRVLVKVEDRDSEYFELFVQQPNGKYISLYKGGGYSISY